MINSDKFHKSRMRKEKFFQFYGIIAILMALSFLIILAYTIGSKGLPGFFQTYINASFDISQEYVDPENTGDEEVIKKGKYRKIFKRVSLIFFLKPLIIELHIGKRVKFSAKVFHFN